MLKYRLITALILIPIVICALFLLPPMVFAVMTLVVCMLAAWEWGQFAGFVTQEQRLWLAILCGFFLVVMLLSMPVYKNPLDLRQIRIPLWLAMGWWVTALLLILTYPRSAVLWRNSRTLAIIFGVLTIVPFFWGIFALRQYGYEQNQETGAWWLLYIMLLVWGSDSGAYFFGKAFGKYKLAAKISPSKTWEGLLGGLLSAALISCLFSYYAPLNIATEKLVICSIVAVLASILGDLTESMFKREADIKDSGHLIPGHGGVLDRIDSLTAAVAVFAGLMLLVF